MKTNQQPSERKKNSLFLKLELVKGASKEGGEEPYETIKDYLDFTSLSENQQKQAKSIGYPLRNKMK